MLGESVTCSPNLGLVERQFSSLAATLGNFSHDGDIQAKRMLKSDIQGWFWRLHLERWYGKGCVPAFLPSCVRYQPFLNIHVVILTPTPFISCPFVTAVGATTQINPEIAASFSGGGFSRYFPAPAYQTKVVSKYLEGLGSKYAGLYK